MAFFGCGDQSSNQQTPPPVHQSVVLHAADEISSSTEFSSVICPVSSDEDISRACEETGKDVVVSVLPRQNNFVSPDEQADLFEIMVTSCKPESVWVESISVNIAIPQGDGDEDMFYTIFDPYDGSAQIIAIEVLEGTQTLIGSSFLQRISPSEAVVYLPQPANDEGQVHLGVVNGVGRIFTVAGWFDFSGGNNQLGRYDISLDNVAVVDQNGYGLSSVVLCNDKQDLKQLVVR